LCGFFVPSLALPVARWAAALPPGRDYTAGKRAEYQAQIAVQDHQSALAPKFLAFAQGGFSLTNADIAPAHLFTGMLRYFHGQSAASF
jgi:hypothetical protein